MIQKEPDEQPGKPDAARAPEGHIASERRFAGLALEAASPPMDQNLVEVKADDGEVEAVNREEEIVKKRKTELTTTRQIETRVKRQLLFEDGKVVEDSGPIVSTNTTEDTDRQETIQTEHRTLGDPAGEDDTGKVTGGSGGPLADAPGDGAGPAPAGDLAPAATEQGVSVSNTPKTIGIAVARADGLLRNIKEEVVVSREETKERTEMTEQRHFGDFTDDAYLRAINSGVDDIRELLLSEKARTELAPSGPQLVQQSISSRKVVDSEDTDIRHLARPDGTLVTEKQQTRQHEELYDDELPEQAAAVAAAAAAGGYDQVDLIGGERLIEQKASAQRYYKQRDEQHVDLVAADGKVIGHEMRYAAEQTQMEKDGRAGPGDGGLLSDWDSLSDRLRKARRLNRHAAKESALLAAAGGAAGVGASGGQILPVIVPATLNDRLDALTKKPLDFDKEEETRKQETSKWLESHFGSESRSSRDSREDLDELVEPTKKTYFNVTIKSNEAAAKGESPAGEMAARERDLYSSVQHQQQQQQQQQRPGGSYAGRGEPPRQPREPREPPGTKFYHCVSEWPGMRGARGSREDMLLLEEPEGNGQHHPSGYRTLEKHGLGGTRKGPGTEREFRENAYHTTPRPPAAGKVAGEQRTFAARYGRSVSPDRHSLTAIHLSNNRPMVPQRRKLLERRQQQQQQQLPAGQPPVQQYPTGKPVLMQAPTMHYAYPVPRSRSISPIQIPAVVSTLRKPYQKTRFRSVQDLSQHATSHSHPQQQQQQQQQARTTSRAQSTPPKSSRVGSAIGNSIRKLMGKIRSASAERKQSGKSKGHAKQHQRSQSPTSSATPGDQQQQQQHKRHSQQPTYQQYNVIDGHISSTDSPPLGDRRAHQQQHYAQQQQQAYGVDSRLQLLVASHKANGVGGRRDGERPRERRGSSDIISDMTTGSGSGGGPTPRQKYYLGENPYGGSIFGKENKYNPAAAAAVAASGSDRRDERHHYSNHTRSFSQPPQTAHHTLGRFSKSTNRLPTMPADRYGPESPDLAYAERPTERRQPASAYAISSQTLPRNDIHRLQRSRPLHSSTINVSIVNTVSPAEKGSTGAVAPTPPITNAGPVKPARTYKALNRSKSFNVHGLNGTNDPSPIYLEKLSGRGYATAPLSGGMVASGGGALHRSNFHLEQGQGGSVQLKSPSIVNLISRSTRDLTQPAPYEDYPCADEFAGTSEAPGGHPIDKKNVFLRNLQNRAPELYRTLHGAELGSSASSPSKEYLGSYITPEQEHLLGTRSAAPLNKDTASIARRGSSSTDDYADTYSPSPAGLNAGAKKMLYRKMGPVRDARGPATLETSEAHTTNTTSRYRGEPALKYQEVHGSPSISGNGTGDGVVIELRGHF